MIDRDYEVAWIKVLGSFTTIVVSILVFFKVQNESIENISNAVDKVTIYLHE